MVVGGRRSGMDETEVLHGFQDGAEPVGLVGVVADMVDWREVVRGGLLMVLVGVVVVVVWGMGGMSLVWVGERVVVLARGWMVGGVVEGLAVGLLGAEVSAG